MKKDSLPLFRFKNSGETLIEVLTAVVILTIVLTTAFSILNRALYANVDNRNRVIALNIAREGIEAVRNIRDTNWLKYSGDRRNKWLCLDTIDEPNSCGGEAGATDQKIHEQTINKFIIFYQDRRYYLSQLRGPTNNGSREVPKEDLNLSSSTDFSAYRLYRDDNGRYTHDSTASGGATPFHRQLELEVINPNTSDIENDPTDDASGYCDESTCETAALHVTSRVQWREDQSVKEAVLETVLFDFFEREEY